MSMIFLRLRSLFTPRRWPAVRPPRPLRQGLLLAGLIAGSLALSPAAKAWIIKPGTPPFFGHPSLWVIAQCGFPGFPSMFCPQPLRLKKLWIFLDPPGSDLSSFTTSFTYDPTLLTFDPTQTSLLCDLRSTSAPPYCPPTNAGKGTMPLATTQDEFVVDKTGLTIKNDPANHAVAIDYLSPVPLTISGERNFLALAFDLNVPLQPGASVTYSPTPSLADATLSITGYSCADAGGSPLDCGSNSPSAALKIDPVPGPLALSGLPVMAHASRRLRRRLQLAGR